MKKIAKFEKVSYNQFKNDFMDSFPQYNEKEVEEIYHSIQLPKRATKGSAGYDFYSPIDFELNPGQTIKIPTGIRVRIENGWVLGLYPRSGLGFKYRLQLNNTVGIIDSDYYNSDNHKLYQDRATGTCNGHRKTWRISYNMVSRTSL